MNLPASLLPVTARVGDLGLEIGGISLVELAEQHGTPLYVYDEQHLRNACQATRAAFPDGVSYASKAFLCRSIARLVHEEGLGLDVASGGELAIAVAAGVPAHAITLHGNNKSRAELKAALAFGIGRIVVDGDDELDRLEVLTAGLDAAPPRVLVRVNPSVTAPTHRSIRTGHADSKFGVPLADGRAAALVRRARKSPGLRFAGIHMHIGSQMTDLTPLRDAIRTSAAFADEVGAGELIVGGGLGVCYRTADTAPTIAAWGEIARRAARDAGFTGRIMAEPGRVLTATAGLTIYTIGARKQTGATRLLAVDGGISDNPRPALYQARYRPLLVRHPYVGECADTFTVVGKNCESSDTFASDVALSGEPRIDDLLCMPVTGAYCHAMSSRYNGLPRPPVVLVRDGAARVIVRRETIEDVLRSDVLDSPIVVEPAPGLLPQ
jgi:diaminopimelate decarboxylase